MCASRRTCDPSTTRLDLLIGQHRTAKMSNDSRPRPALWTTDRIQLDLLWAGALFAKGLAQERTNVRAEQCRATGTPFTYLPMPASRSSARNPQKGRTHDERSTNRSQCLAL